MAENATARNWNVALGIPGLLYALGAAMMFANPSLFWPGAALTFLAALFLAWDWWRVSRSLSSTARWVGALVTAVLIWVPVWVAFRPAPLEKTFESPDMEYSEGSDLHGIKWNSAYSEARIMLINQTDSEYDNIDIFVETDISIIQIAIVGDYTKRIDAPDTRFEFVLIGKDASGNNLIQPQETIAGPIAPIYRINCDKIIGHSSVMLDLALIKLNRPAVGEKWPKIMTTPRTTPKWILVDLSYDGLGRRRHEIFHHCLKLACGPVPKEILVPNSKS